MTEHRAFIGDGERVLKLTPAVICELERKTGVGIGALSRRVFAGDFRHADLIETIRLAMVAGGERPERAGELTALYVNSMPLAEAHALAVKILSALWFGKSGEESTDDN